MHLSIFEALMLLCFGISWPFSLWKSWKSRQNGSKSLIFLVLVFVGYLAGITNKILNHPDWVLALYVLNAVLVAADLILFFRNRALAKRSS
ncbi:MAG: hypothetical protein HKM05_01265 [Spirochaetales bacterium]|nr:hypothetical protein [Spirochaetales bacterium]